MTVSGEDRGILIKMQIEYLGCGGAWMEDMDGHRTLFSYACTYMCVTFPLRFVLIISFKF